MEKSNAKPPVLVSCLAWPGAGALMSPLQFDSPSFFLVLLQLGMIFEVPRMKLSLRVTFLILVFGRHL